MVKIIYVLLIMATLVVAIIFASINYTHVPLDYFLGEGEWPLSILLISAFLAGLLFGVLMDAWVLFRQRNRVKSLEKTVDANQTELDNLRNLPLRDLEK